MHTVKMVFAALAFVSASHALAAPAENCSEKDYRGLKFDSRIPPVYAEEVCQLKLFLLRRNNADSLGEFMFVYENSIGFGQADIDWKQPLIPVINDIVNRSLEEKSVHKLAQAAQKFYAGPGSRYVLDSSELELLRVLAKIEIK